MVLVPTVYGDGLVIQENQSGFAGVDGSIDVNYAGYTGSGFANTIDAVGADVNWSLNFDSSIPKSFTFRYASAVDQWTPVGSSKRHKWVSSPRAYAQT